MALQSLPSTSISASIREWVSLPINSIWICPKPQYGPTPTQASSAVPPISMQPIRCRCTTTIYRTDSLALPLHTHPQHSLISYHSQYPIKGLIQETICKDSCMGFNVSGTDFCSIACNVSLDVCSECAGNQTRMQLCFPPDPNRESFYTLPTCVTFRFLFELIHPFLQ